MTLVEVLLVGLLAAAFLAPSEALRWWARQQVDPRESPLEDPPAPSGQADRTFLVHLTGVGALSGEQQAAAEGHLLREVQRRVPGLVVVRGVYPYSVQNLGLTSGRNSSWFWRRVARLARRRGTVGGWLSVLVYLRNVLQFAVCADDRYGPMYSIGIGRVVVNHLQEAGFVRGSNRAVVLFGWSGGAQMAVSAARYLTSLGIPVQVVSLGGVITSDPGLERIEHLWQLVGSRDWVPSIGRLFPGRWPGRRHGYWAELVASGRLTELDIGAMRHLGRGSYLSRAQLADGRTCRETSVEAVASVLHAVLDATR